ncbi:MAG: hypothetical protein Kow0010_17690 [Dehalococcoidia bacterium]
MPGRTWFLPLAVVAACLPCLVVLVGPLLVAGGLLGGLLGLLGIPWVLAVVIAVAIALTLAALRIRHRRSTACELPERPEPESHATLRSGASDPVRHPPWRRSS